MILTQKYDEEFFQKVFQNRKIKAYGKHGHFSVLVPLVYKEQEPFLLFEVRADHLRKQPGEVCFPGGKVEPKESTRGCALRETMEELNIPMNQIKVISELDYIHTYSNFTLYSFLGVLQYEDVKDKKFSRSEVKDTFLVPLAFFLEQVPFAYTMSVEPNAKDFPYDLIKQDKGEYNWRKGKTTVQIYEYEDHVIWGLTAKIVEHLVHVLRCEGADKNENSFMSNERDK